MAKRVFDLLFSAFGIVLLLPLLVLIWLLIKVTDPGDAFFRQTRVGRFGVPFQIVKFRTMKAGGGQGPLITATGDARITKIGAMLRKAKLDELPQLWNVLCGDMSLVGPRPEVPRYVACYTAEQNEVLQLRPGITDEASLAFRHEEAMLAAAPDPERFYIEQCIPRKIALNLAYARRASVARDFALIVRTLAAVWLKPKACRPLHTPSSSPGN